MLSLPHRRGDFAAGNHFSFFSPVSKHDEYETWAENLKTLDNSFGKSEPRRKFGPWVRTIRAPCEPDSDAFSPPLWKSGSPESRNSNTRAQMIAKYRQEMMDLVRDLPETAYELSLKDLVESPPNQKREKTVENQEEEKAVLTGNWKMNKGKGKGMTRKGAKIGIINSGGFLLKLFMPAVAVSGRKESSSVGSKISPRPIAIGERSSSNGSSNSGCSRSESQRWKLGACCSFRQRSSFMEM